MCIVESLLRFFFQNQLKGAICKVLNEIAITLWQKIDKWKKAKYRNLIATHGSQEGIRKVRNWKEKCGT